jgi:high-affinity nickel permease
VSGICRATTLHPRWEGDVIGDLNENLAKFGYAVVGIFMLSWIVSVIRLSGQGL